MHFSNPDDCEKFPTSSAPASSAPPPYSGQLVSGIPIGPGNQVRPSLPGPWTTDLCGCFDDVPNCCITFWCPCITFGRIAEIVDKGSTSCGANGALYALIYMLTGCGCIYSCFYRSKLRQQYMLSETPCADCCVHLCCEECALCQEYRELKNRGFDMSIGWEGNVEKQRQVAPMFEAGMTR